MTLKYVKAWYDRLPPYERDLPIIILEGYAYTPRMILSEVERGTDIGRKLQKYVESGRLGTTLRQEQQLAKIRLKEILGKMPEKPIIASLSGKTYTPSQLLKEIEQETGIGKQWIQNEIKHAKRMLVI